jgi:hypothetical protein
MAAPVQKLFRYHLVQNARAEESTQMSSCFPISQQRCYYRELGFARAWSEFCVRDCPCLVTACTLDFGIPRIWEKGHNSMKLNGTRIQAGNININNFIYFHLLLLLLWLLLLLLLLLYIHNSSIPSNTTISKDMCYSYMFRPIKSLSGWVKNHGILQNGCAHLGSQMAYSVVLNPYPYL